MQTLRPFIIHSSPEFELRTFKERHDRGASPLLLTRQWLTQAHQRLDASQYSLSYPTRAFPYSSLGKRTHVILSTLKGLIDLVFAPLSPVPLSSPPVTTTMPSNQSVPTVVSQLSGYPETLYLDHSRLILLTRDAADLTAVYALLMLYRQLVFSSSSTPSNPRRDASLDDADLQRLKLEIWEIGPPNLGRHFLHPAAGAQAPPPPSQNEKEKESQRWDDALKAVALQLTARATEARSAPTKTPSPSSLPVCAPDEHLLKTAESWVDSHLKTDSALTALMRNRLRDAVFDSVVSTVLIRGSMTPAALAPEVGSGTAGSCSDAPGRPSTVDRTAAGAGVGAGPAVGARPPTATVTSPATVSTVASATHRRRADVSLTTSVVSPSWISPGSASFSRSAFLSAFWNMLRDGAYDSVAIDAVSSWLLVSLLRASKSSLRSDRRSS